MHVQLPFNNDARWTTTSLEMNMKTNLRWKWVIAHFNCFMWKNEKVPENDQLDVYTVQRDNPFHEYQHPSLQKEDPIYKNESNFEVIP